MGEIALIEAEEGILRTSRGCWEVRTCGREGFSSAISVLVSLSEEVSFVYLTDGPLPRPWGVVRPVSAGELLMLLLFLRDFRG